MIWLIIGSSLYTVILIALGFWLSSIWYRHIRQDMQESHLLDTKSQNQPSPKTSQDSPSSGALKSMTPYERSLEDSKEITERIEHLIS